MNSEALMFQNSKLHFHFGGEREQSQLILKQNLK